ncbi:hypothetical protein CASFOL_028471 [Castilleja foliolosa]|uniref:DRBM domain-containing protein n=1 Tax=Castilleja foliolosa TaxID=1961234 RepID=A0ABD3CC00_9LAMI
MVFVCVGCEAVMQRSAVVHGDGQQVFSLCPGPKGASGRTWPIRRALSDNLIIANLITLAINLQKMEGPIAALKELCMMEGLGVAFQTQPQFSANPGLRNEVYAQVEVNGQVLGKGIRLTWDEAKSEAAEKALVALKSMPGQFSYRYQGSPSILQSETIRELTKTSQALWFWISRMFGAKRLRLRAIVRAKTLLTNNSSTNEAHGSTRSRKAHVGLGTSQDRIIRALERVAYLEA